MKIPQREVRKRIEARRRKIGGMEEVFFAVAGVMVLVCGWGTRVNWEERLSWSMAIEGDFFLLLLANSSEGPSSRVVSQGVVDMENCASSRNRFSIMTSRKRISRTTMEMIKPKTAWYPHLAKTMPPRKGAIRLPAFNPMPMYPTYSPICSFPTVSTITAKPLVQTTTDARPCRARPTTWPATVRANQRIRVAPSRTRSPTMNGTRRDFVRSVYQPHGNDVTTLASPNTPSRMATQNCTWSFETPTRSSRL